LQNPGARRFTINIGYLTGGVFQFKVFQTGEFERKSCTRGAMLLGLLVAKD